MKNILIFLSVALLMFSGCDSYLETDTYNQIDSENAFKTASDIKAARNGLYYALGSYRFCGNYVLAIGDFAADISVADGSSGHFVTINDYSFTDTQDELEKVWEYGYSIVNTATQMIPAINVLLANEETTDADKDDLNLYLAEVHALRAMAYFHMVNIFGLPYGTDSNPHGGLVLMDEQAIMPTEDVSRSSVVETYTLIMEDISNSLSAFDKTTSEMNGFYLNEAGVNALKARILLFMGDYQNAILAADKALTLKAAKSIGEADYLGMWKSLTLGEEEIFSIAKTEDDNLSANSLNTLYGSYKGSLYSDFKSDFGANDYRLNLIDNTHPMKFDGIESSAATSNIPQLRVSEMYLIKAECNANLGLLDVARTALLFTAKRNGDITDVTDLPTTKSDLLQFIAKERKREFFQEGHRFYDARRTSEKISVQGSDTDFDVSKFVYPIPADEINSGFKCEQNEGWFNNLPIPKK
ncbi:RagB/SusD family nutrient uptake outer membrane protein [Labilibaculum euxinus]|uniref:RagB/SusD family nutrient uptake outer membrane protein n=1 Tax=Labilibaculum euxinus TaxID=2686357 RepID=A0A7M4D1V5_9BACT|nr:RagB/SusD family nutrient uptake outer membrane protein [Labilibaculum euxinus]MUP36634.1 RagB/SusD family nutrient uptake outer membrane protein [Labilibaculum euxinus]MVB05839.1 RagB/SusD family nutrient uptake outer membrane protein [Labilibaculum euxinus]